MDDWIVADWFPKQHRIMDTAPEGSYKTIMGLWLAVCIASGVPFLGQKVKQGKVLIKDEETPEPTLVNLLQRFALGVGIPDWRILPIEYECMRGFRFGRKEELNRLMEKMDKFRPRLLRMDSVLAMLPGYRQGLVENDSSTGIALRDDMNKLLKLTDIISISAHSKKQIAELSLAQVRAKDMQLIVRGHGSIVGEACDTGLVIKKVSEWPDRSIFVVTTKARRSAIPMASGDVYVELKEESYGKGKAWLERIEPIALPPSSMAKELFILFSGDPTVVFSSSKIRYSIALDSPKDIKAGLMELVEHNIVKRNEKLHYYLNKNLNELTGENLKYLRSLEQKDARSS